MSGTIRVADLPDLGTITDATVFVADKAAATGKFTALTIKNYVAITTLPEAPSTNTPYGRMNGAWTPVLPDAPSNGTPYGRLNGGWSPVIPPAPADGQTYGRSNAGWTQVLPITGGTLNGSIAVSANLTCNNLYANSMAMSSTNGFAWDFYVLAGGDQVQQHAANWTEVFDPSNGSRAWNSPSGQQMVLDGASVLSVTGYVTSPAFWSNIAAAVQFGFGAGGSGRIFSFRSSFYLDHSTIAGATDGTLQYVVSNGPLWVMRASDDFCYNNQSVVGGHGAYTDISDRRVKNNIAPATQGLDVILRLQPVTFTRKSMSRTPRPNHTPKQEIGFVAQDLAAVLPESVRAVGVELPDGTGGLEDVDPTLGMTASTITAVSVNAIKELHAMIATLMARVATLEGSAA